VPLLGRATLDRRAGAQLSAQTAKLAVTPHPLGKPGGPGLYGIKGESLPPYIENLAAKLEKVNGWSKSRAIATAINNCKKWAAGGGNVTPEVQAVAAAALAALAKSQAKAKSMSNEVEMAALVKGKDGKTRAVDDPAVLSAHRKLVAKGVRPKVAMTMAMRAAKSKKEKAVGSSTTFKAESYTARHGTPEEKARAMSRLKARSGGKRWNEAAHPRGAKGSSTGGKFVSSGKASAK